MDLNQVLIFVEVVKAGSFTGAARALKLPKTTVSRKVAALEAALGIRLLNRTTRSLSLTDAGRRYEAVCRDAVASIEAASRDVAGEQEVPTGTVRISAPVDDHFLAEAVPEFLARHHGVAVEVVLTDEHLDLIAERIDIALRGGRLADSSLVARRLASGPIFVCASPDYLAAAGRPAHPDDLRHHSCIVHGRSVDGGSWVLEGPDGTVHAQLASRLAVNSMMFAVRAAAAGQGLALIPESIAAGEIAKGRLERVLLDWRAPTGGLFLVYPSNRHQPAAVRALAYFIAGKMAEFMPPRAA